MYEGRGGYPSQSKSFWAQEGGALCQAVGNNMQESPISRSWVNFAAFVLICQYCMWLNCEALPVYQLCHRNHEYFAESRLELTFVWWAYRLVILVQTNVQQILFTKHLLYTRPWARCQCWEHWVMCHSGTVLLCLVCAVWWWSRYWSCIWDVRGRMLREPTAGWFYLSWTFNWTLCFWYANSAVLVSAKGPHVILCIVCEILSLKSHFCPLF